MATRKRPAPEAARSAAPVANEQAGPIDARLSGYSERGGVQYPSLIVPGPAPAKGAALRVTIGNGVTYGARVVDAAEIDGEVLVETAGLEPEVPGAAAPAPSDIVPG